MWSFREYLNLRCGWQLKTATLEDVVKGKVDFQYGAERPLMCFDEYMKKGCYPFSLKSLTYFDDAEQDPMPVMMVTLEWEDVKFLIVVEVGKFMKK